jgi:hypothetical protein
MTHASTQSGPSGPPPGPSGPPPGSGLTPQLSGGAVFAGVLMVVYGFLGLLQGIAGLAADDVYYEVRNYTFEFNLTAWGWIHLILGVVLIAVGWGILSRQTWAKVLGIALAAFMVVVYFAWMPYQPIWSLIAVAIGIFVIWALATDDSL